MQQVYFGKDEICKYWTSVIAILFRLARLLKITDRTDRAHNDELTKVGFAKGEKTRDSKSKPQQNYSRSKGLL